MVTQCRKLSQSSSFQNFILAVIIFTAALMGVETEPEIYAKYKGTFDLLNHIIQAIFIAEIVIRIVGYGRRPYAFFADGWNVFDFVIVAASMLPQAGPFAMVARLARLLRLARLISSVPKLRLIIETMLRSIPSLSYIALLLGIIMYIYAIIGVHLFQETSPEKWGSLGVALLTLFEILTLEGWSAFLHDSMAVYPLAWIYYVSYIVVAVFIVVNLIIAVVIDNLDAVREEMHAWEVAKVGKTATMERLHRMREDINELEKELTEKGSV